MPSTVGLPFLLQLAVMTSLLSTGQTILDNSSRRVSVQLMLGCDKLTFKVLGCDKLTFKNNHHGNQCLWWKMCAISMQGLLSPSQLVQLHFHRPAIRLLSLKWMSPNSFPSPCESYRNWEISDMEDLWAIEDVIHRSTRTWQKFSKARLGWKMLGLK